MDVSWRPFYISAETGAPKFDEWKGPIRQSIINARNEAIRKACKTSAMELIKIRATMKECIDAGCKAKDVFESSAWFRGITPSQCETLGLTWKELRTMGMTRQHILRAEMPKQKWKTLFKADDEFERVYMLETVARGDRSTGR